MRNSLLTCSPMRWVVTARSSWKTSTSRGEMCYEFACQFEDEMPKESQRKVRVRRSTLMDFDVRGCVQNIQLPQRAAFSPVCEAVVNSIHATQDQFGEHVADLGEVSVTVHRVQQPSIQVGAETGVTDVLGFTVTDNGTGFNDENMESFRTAYSTAKRDRGGKGIGRLSWLVLCDEAIVDSTFLDREGKLVRRSFVFRLTRQAIENVVMDKHAGTDSRSTVVHLRGIRSRYAAALRTGTDVMVQRLFEQCFGYLVLGACPKIRIVDELADGTVTVDIMDKLSAIHVGASMDLVVGDHRLKVRYVEEPRRSGRNHAAHLCANERVVESVSLARASDLGSKPIPGHNGEPAIHHVFVSGDALDARVDGTRTRFEFDDEGSVLAGYSTLDRKGLMDAISQHANAHLGERLHAVREENYQQISKHIQTKQPEYRGLLVHRSDSLRQLELSNDPKQIDEVLYREQQAWEAEIRRMQADVEKKLDSNKADVQGVADELSRVIEQVGEAGKSNLVRYVAKRRAVLGFLKTLLDTGAIEAEVHRIVFPMRRTSSDVTYDEHNLWLLDDTLSFYEFVASDVPLAGIPGIGVESDRRPDILAFKVGDPPFQHVALVELKRPGRDNANPVQQLVDYAFLLRKGGAKTASGSVMPGIPLSVRIDAFAVASLGSELPDLLATGPGDLVQAPGEWRWYGGVRQLNLTIEVFDFNAFVVRAEQRNRAFFTKLGLP